jgi:hypothetical protein
MRRSLEGKGCKTYWITLSWIYSTDPPHIPFENEEGFVLMESMIMAFPLLLSPLDENIHATKTGENYLVLYSQPES